MHKSETLSMQRAEAQKLNFRYYKDNSYRRHGYNIEVIQINVYATAWILHADKESIPEIGHGLFGETAKRRSNNYVRLQGLELWRKVEVVWITLRLPKGWWYPPPTVLHIILVAYFRQTIHRILIWFLLAIITTNDVNSNALIRPIIYLARQ